MRIQSLEPTPNPNAFKFILDQELSETPRSFQSQEAANASSLAKAIFEIGGIESVFYFENFVTVAKTEDADWENVMTQAGQLLIDFEIEDLVEEATQAESGEATSVAADDEELLEKITLVVDEMVRPALAGDGGGLDILSLENNTVFIRYQGACGTCPSAITGTLGAIERLIQHQVSPDLKVVAA